MRHQEARHCNWYLLDSLHFNINISSWLGVGFFFQFGRILPLHLPPASRRSGVDQNEEDRKQIYDKWMGKCNWAHAHTGSALSPTRSSGCRAPSSLFCILENRRLLHCMLPGRGAVVMGVDAVVALMGLVYSGDGFWWGEMFLDWVRRLNVHTSTVHTYRLFWSSMYCIRNLTAAYVNGRFRLTAFKSVTYIRGFFVIWITCCVVY